MTATEKAREKRRILYASVKQELSQLGEVKAEYQFLQKRKFRFDYAVPSLKVAIEINGGQFINGRHNRGGKGYEADLEKLNLAQLTGWTVLQYTYQQIEKGKHTKEIQTLKKIQSTNEQQQQQITY